MPMPLTDRRPHRWLARVALLLMLSLTGPTAWACTVSPSVNVAFGSVSSFVIASTPQTTSAQPNAGITCQGSILGLLGTQRINATLTSTNEGELRNAASSDVIPYHIFADLGANEEIVLGETYNYFNSTLLDILSIFGGTSWEMPMEFRTQFTDNVAAGTYVDTLIISWDWRICNSLLCLLPREGSGTNTINLSLTVTPDCAISSPDLNFGSAPLVAGFDPVTQTIDITCTKGSDYSVGLSDGQHPAGAIRRMEHDGHYLEYQLYKGSAGSERWGHAGGERRASSGADINPGTPSGVTSQGFTYRGEILPGQDTPPPGTYTDVIVVDVVF